MQHYCFLTSSYQPDITLFLSYLLFLFKH